MSATYVGLDVSLAATSVCVLDDSGAVVFEGKARSTPEAIAAVLADRAPGVVRVGLETGPTSAWLWRGLVALGVPAVCLEARHARAALSARTHKTDRNDARGLAELVRVGWYREARVREADAQVVRALLLARRRLVDARRGVENQLRGIAKAFGLFADASTAGRGFLARMRRAAEEQPELLPVLRPLLTVHAAITEQVGALTARIVAAARRDAAARRMMTTPGVGALTAMAFRTAVGDPGRFRSSAQAGAFFGLAPRVHQSGETDRTGRITKAGDTMTRSYLFEAAGVLLKRVPRPSALKAWGTRLAERVGLKRAKVAVARKLAVLLHALWKGGAEFDWARQAARPA